MKIFFLIGLLVILFYLPVILNPQLVLERNNDLQEFFWPIIYFAKNQVLQNHAIPLWNNMIFAGTPLLPDPQSPLFYLPNIIFLILPIDIGFLVSIVLHIFWGAVGVYLCSRTIFNLSKTSSLLTSVMFILSPKLIGFLEAGHFGLLTSFSWIPYLIMAIVMIARSPKFKWSLLLTFSLAALFYTHILIFGIVLISSILLFLFLLIPKSNKSSIKLFLLSIIFAFGLTTIQFFPQMSWINQTTRFLLLTTRETYPNWISIREFLQNILTPWFGGISNIQSIDSEKLLALGIFPILISIYGFLNLQRKLKIILLIVTLPIILVSLNNASPLYHLLLKFDPFVLLRVSTRIWFILTFIVIFLTGFGIELLQKKFPRAATIIATATIFELILLSYPNITRPVPDFKRPPETIYQFLKSDNELFRIYCTTRCLSQKKVAEYGIEIIDGYNTLQQINYYKQAWQLTGGYWNYYTLSIPPIGLYKFDKPQPDPASLGLFNTKYIISPYKLENNDFILETEFDEFKVYRNNLWSKRAFFWTEDQKPKGPINIVRYSPNYIKVDTSKSNAPRLVLSEVWSPGWKAFLNGTKEVPVQQTPIGLRLVDLQPNTSFVEFKYDPPGFRAGLFITLITLITIAVSILSILFPALSKNTIIHSALKL